MKAYKKSESLWTKCSLVKKVKTREKKMKTVKNQSMLGTFNLKSRQKIPGT